MKVRQIWHSKRDGWQVTTWRESKRGGKRRFVKSRPADFDEIPKR